MDVLAFGMDDGLIYLLPREIHKNPDFHQTKPVVIKKYDAAVCAIAVAMDGLCVAVGLKDGSTKIYCFNATTDTLNAKQQHSFLSTSTAHENNGKRDQEPDLAVEVTSFERPHMGSSICQLAFDPRSRKDCYYLAIVLINNKKPLKIVDITSKKVCDYAEIHFDLGDEAVKVHGKEGIRSVAYGWTGDYDDSKCLADCSQMTLATLGMDGRLVTWNLAAGYGGRPCMLWKRCHCHSDHFDSVSTRNAAAVDTALDMFPDRAVGGTVSDTNALEVDRASGVTWGILEVGKQAMGCLILPGKKGLHFQSCPLHMVGKHWKLFSAKDREEKHKMQHFTVTVEECGHDHIIDSIAFQPRLSMEGNDKGTRKLAVGTRDGKLLLWEFAMLRQNDTSYSVRASILGELHSGTAPITSIVWLMDQGEDVIYAACVDGATILLQLGKAIKRECSKTRCRLGNDCYGEYLLFLAKSHPGQHLLIPQQNLEFLSPHGGEITFRPSQKKPKGQGCRIPLCKLHLRSVVEKTNNRNILFSVGPFPDHVSKDTMNMLNLLINFIIKGSLSSTAKMSTT